MYAGDRVFYNSAQKDTSLFTYHSSYKVKVSRDVYIFTLTPIIIE